MATSMVIGQVEPFKLGMEDWEQHTEGLKQVNGTMMRKEAGDLFDGTECIDLCLAE